jgi:hypothetical protein
MHPGGRGIVATKAAPPRKRETRPRNCFLATLISRHFEALGALFRPGRTLRQSGP